MHASLTTLKDRATQPLIKFKTGALNAIFRHSRNSKVIISYFYYGSINAHFVANLENCREYAFSGRFAQIITIEH